MFSRKAKTVASVMESFRNTIADLQEIVETTIAKNTILNEQLTTLEDQIEEADLEIHQARGVKSRLHDLVFGPGITEDDINE